MNRLVAIVGPTGIGKSRLALHLAQIFQGEIVSADSRLVYRYMDIGTAKPVPEELSLVPHHLINIINPDEDFSLAQYQMLAYQAIQDIQRRHKLPLLVGGSGLYVRAALEGWKVPEVPPDHKLRDNLKKEGEEIGPDALYNELVKVDPEAARKIDRRNIRRVIRALEVQKRTERPFSSLRRKEKPPFSSLIVGLTAAREEVYRRTDQRVDAMIKQGLVAEVEKLVKIGYDFNLPAMSGIGYKQVGMFLRGELTLDAAIQKIKTETHRFVRHQYAWFQLEDERIHWFDIQELADFSEIEGLLSEFVKSD